MFLLFRARITAWAGYGQAMLEAGEKEVPSCWLGNLKQIQNQTIYYQLLGPSTHVGTLTLSRDNILLHKNSLTRKAIFNAKTFIYHALETRGGRGMNSSTV